MAWELPPRARRILLLILHHLVGGGTTSACAENTCGGIVDQCSYRNYLRVRGEYNDETLAGTSASELPPRARRILIADHGHNNIDGTTSACAENTHEGGEGSLRRRNYLRVRGEYLAPGWSWPRAGELPPRARRILRVLVKPFFHSGTTSACAENTTAWIRAAITVRNYLRVRGEYLSLLR